MTYFIEKKVNSEAGMDSSTSFNMAHLAKKTPVDTASSTELEEVVDVRVGEENSIEFASADYSMQKKKWRKGEVTFDSDDQDCGKIQKCHQDEDYTYRQLLNRLNHLSNTGAASEGGRRDRKKLPAPEIAHQDRMKTLFMNFGQLCHKLHRSYRDVANYLGSELSTRWNVKENGKLLRRGRYEREDLMRIIRLYVLEYVRCSSCKSRKPTWYVIGEYD